MIGFPLLRNTGRNYFLSYTKLNLKTPNCCIKFTYNLISIFSDGKVVEKKKKLSFVPYNPLTLYNQKMY